MGALAGALAPPPPAAGGAAAADAGAAGAGAGGKANVVIIDQSRSAFGGGGMGGMTGQGISATISGVLARAFGFDPAKLQQPMLPYEPGATTFAA